MSDKRNLLTFLLPLRGRVGFTDRWMGFMEQTCFPFRIVLADGGADEDLTRKLSDPASYPSLDYVYRRFPYDSDYAHYYAKMATILSEIDTPFVALSDNDSFPISSGLEKSLDFLLGHDDYSACRGQHVDYMLECAPDDSGGELFGTRIRIHRLYYDKRHTIWRSLESENTLDRIEEWSHYTNINFYNVHRREHVLAAWQWIAKCDLMDLFMTDIAVTFFTLVAGKTKVFDYPFIMRQQNTSIAASKEAIRKADILDRMLVEQWTADLNRLSEVTAEMISAKEGCEVDFALAGIKKSLKNHFADRLFTYLKQRNAMMKKDPDCPDITISDYMEISRADELQGDFGYVARYLLRDVQC